MNDQTKLNITATGDSRITLEGAYIELEDKTTELFRTNDFKSFKDFLNKKSSDYSLYAADGKSIKAFSNIDKGYYKKEIAELTVTEHPIIRAVFQVNSKEVELQVMSNFLRRVKKYCTTGTLDMLSNLDDLKVKKVISVEQGNDRKGNFNFSVRAEKGTGDYEFPESISLKLPVYEEFPDELFEIEFDFSFRWAVVEDKVLFTAMIDNCEFLMTVQEMKAILLAEKFKEESDNGIFYLGSLEVTPRTDKDLYMKNEAVLKG